MVGLEPYLHIKSITVPLYRGNFVIIISNSAEKVNNILPDYDLKHVYGHARMDTYKKQQGFFIILNPDFKCRVITHGVVSHEALHIANFIADARGIEPSFSNDEAITYLQCGTLIILEK